jgi:hypothetical protein
METKQKVSRIDIIGQNGNDGLHYEANTIFKQHISIDIETLGTAPGSGIIAIGAVAFTLDSLGGGFYTKVKAESCINSGLTLDHDTMKWWHGQDEEVREEAFSGTESIESALHELAKFIFAYPSNTLIWGNGANFDIVLLEEAYRRTGVSCRGNMFPWSYKNIRCLRTVVSMFPHIKPVESAIKHNAYEDATAQALTLMNILQQERPSGLL